jgi:hypothetical protein
MEARLNRPRLALSSYRQAQAIGIQQYRGDSGNLFKRLQLMESQNKVCGVLGTIAPKEADAECGRAARFMNATTLDPSNAGFLGYLAGQYFDMGGVYDTLASRSRASKAEVRRFREAAVDMYRRSSEIWSDLRDRRLVNPTDSGRVTAATLTLARAKAALNQSHPDE